MNSPINNQEFKADGGKLRPTLLLEGMPRALLLVMAVLAYGEQKYEAHTWKRVSSDRYKDAKLRHLIEELAGLGECDDESGLLHLAHEACNTLFILEQRVADLSVDEFKALLRFREPPLTHKTQNHVETEPNPVSGSAAAEYNKTIMALGQS